jgi:4-amino-4-deoxy-L-arabinose transferase-like glycosyltransferase
MSWPNRRGLVLGFLLAAFVGLFASVLLARPPLDVAVPSAAAHPFLAWFEPDPGQGPFLWTTPDSVIVLHGWDGERAVLTLHVRPSGEVGRLTASLPRPEFPEAKSPAAFDLLPRWLSLEVELPRRAAPGLRLRPVAVALSTDATVERGSLDVGIKIDRVTLRSLEPPRLGPALLRTAYMAWLLAVAWLAFQRLRRRLGGTERVALLGDGLAVVIALGLLAAARASPYVLAWALPPLPALLGAASLVLAWPRIRDRVRPVAAASLSAVSAGGGALAARRGGRVAALLLVVLAVAAGLRFYRLRELPFGLWRDAARHGLVALRILEDPDYRPVYVAERGVNLPALGFYVFAVPLALGPIRPWSLRPLTALAGALCVLPLYALVRRTTGRTDAALLAAALLACSSWAVSVSRLSFPTIFDPLLALAAFWLTVVGLEEPPAGAAGARPRWPWLAGGGAALGLALHTYHSARGAVLIAVWLLFLRLRRSPHAGRTLAPWAAAFLAVAAPLVVYAAAHPKEAAARVRQVSLVHNALLAGESPLGALDDSAGRHLLMLHVRGDGNGRHHLAGAPLLDPVTGAAFLVGVAALLAAPSGWADRLWPGGLLLGAVPSLLAVDGPHGLRAIGALPFACAIAAIGMCRAADRLPGAARVATIGAALVAVFVLNADRYFRKAATDGATWSAFYPVQTGMGAFMRTVAERSGVADLPNVYLSETMREHPVIAYLTHGLAVSTFDADGLLSRPPAPGACFVLGGSAYPREAEALSGRLQAPLAPVFRGPPFPTLEQPTFVVDQATEGPLAAAGRVCDLPSAVLE